MDISRQFSVVIVILAGLSVLLEITGFASSGWLSVHKSGTNNELSDHTADKLTAQENNGHSLQVPGSDNQTPNKPAPLRPGKPLRPMLRPRPNPNQPTPIDNGDVPIPEDGVSNSDPPAKPSPEQQSGPSSEASGKPNPSKPAPLRPGKPLRPMLRPRPNPNQPTPIDNGGVPIPEDGVSNSDPPAKPSPEQQSGPSSEASGKPNPSKPAPLRPGKPLRPMLRPRPNPNQPTPIDNGGVPIPEDGVSNSDPPAKPSLEQQNGTSSDASGKPNPSKPAPLRPGKPLRPMLRPRPNPNQPTPIDNDGVPIPEDGVSNSDPPAKPSPEQQSGPSSEASGKPNPSKPAPLRPGKPLRPMLRPRPNPNQPRPIDNGGVPIPEDGVSNSDPPAKPSPEQQSGPSSEASGKPNPSKPAPLRPGKPLRPMLRPRPNPNQPRPIDNGGVPIPEDGVSNSDPPAKPSPEQQSGPSSEASGKPNPSKPAPLRPGKPLRPMLRPRPNPNQPRPIDNGGVPIPEDGVSNSDPPAKPSPEQQSGPSSEASGKPNPSKPAPLRPGKPLRPMLRPRPNPNQPRPIDNGGVPIPEDGINTGSRAPAKPSPEEQIGSSSQASGKPNPNMQNMQRPGMPARPRPKENQATPMDNGGVPIPIHGMPSNDVPAKSSLQNKDDADFMKSKPNNPNHPMHGRLIRSFSETLNRPAPLDDGVPVPGNDLNPNDVPAKPSPEEHTSRIQTRPAKPNLNPGSLTRPLNERPKPTLTGNGGVNIIKNNVSAAVKPTFDKQNGHARPHVNPKPEKLVRPFFEKPNQPTSIDNGGIQIPNDKEDRGLNSEGKMPVGPDPPKSEESQNLAIRPSAQPGIGARIATLRPPKEGGPTINPYLKSIIKDKFMPRKSGAATAANNKSDESSIAEGVDSDASSTESQVASSAHKETSWDLNMGLWVSRCCINTMAGSKDCIWLSLSDSFLLLQNELPGRTIANDVGGMATWNDLRVETVFGICSGVIGLVATVLTVKPLCLDGRKRVTTIIGICGLALSCILFLVPIARVVSIKSSVDGSHESLGDQTLDTQLPWAAAVSGLGACLALVTAGFLGFYTWADERNKWKKFDDSSAIVFKNGGQSSVGEKPLKEIHFSSEVTNETRAL